MSGTDQKKDGDGKSPEVNKKTDGDGTPKPGLIIDVVLPDEKAEVERDPRKEH